MSWNLLRSGDNSVSWRFMWLIWFRLVYKILSIPFRYNETWKSDEDFSTYSSSFKLSIFTFIIQTHLSTVPVYSHSLKLE